MPYSCQALPTHVSLACALISVGRSVLVSAISAIEAGKQVAGRREGLQAKLLPLYRHRFPVGKPRTCLRPFDGNATWHSGRSAGY